VRLDGRFRYAKLIGDLLVEQSFRQHHQDPHLLRRQGRHARDQRGGLIIGACRQIDVARGPDAAGQDPRDRLANILVAGGLRNETGRSDVHAAPDHDGIVIRRYHDDRHAWILSPQINQPRKTVDTRHRQIKQDKIDVIVLFKVTGDLIDGAGLGNFGTAELAGDGLTQCAPEQGMIICDDQMMPTDVRHKQRP